MQSYNSKFKKFTVSFFILIFSFSIVVSVRADTDVNQQILDLRAKIDQLTKLAAQYKGTVLQKQKEANTLKRQIDIINNQILKLQTDIQISTEKIQSTKLQISDLQSKIFDTQKSIGTQQSAVGEIMRYLDQRDSTNLVATLVSTQRLSDFADQAQHISQLNGQLSELLKNLKLQKTDLEKNVGSLNEQKVVLEDLNKKQTTQKQSLDIGKTSKNKLLIDTRGQEAKYQQLLTEAEKKEAEFYNDLKAIESQAVTNGVFIVHVTAKSVPARGTKIFQFPEGDRYLTQSYGMTAYAKRRAYGGAPHNGIDLVYGLGDGIRPIGSGVVLAASYNVGFGNWVAVRHDNDMVSVYAHFQAPSGLAVGTKVDTSSVLGYEGRTGNVTGEHLHLSLYRDFFTYINPKNKQLYFNYFEGSVNPLDYIK